MKYPKELQKLIEFLKMMPGVGKKTAERYAFDLIKWDTKYLDCFGQLLTQLKNNLTHCKECGALVQDECTFCHARDTSIMCIVSSIKDIYAIEESSSFQGLYHVLPHMLSPLENLELSEEELEQIEKRIEKNNTQEIILALDATLEGDATALFLKQKLEDKNIFISRLALGIPMGSSLDFVDEGTLSRAFCGRLPY